MRRNELGTNDQDLEQLTALFRLLADKTRLNILLLLINGERNVTTLSKHLRLPQPTVSHHLGLLRMNNVIGARRVGKQVFYGFNGHTGPDGDTLVVNAQRFDIRICSKTDGQA